MLEPGKKAPSFRLEGADGKEYGLKDFADKTLILYFYPRDNTPGCTTEAQEFRDALPKLKKLGSLLWESVPTAATHTANFRKNMTFLFCFLATRTTKPWRHMGPMAKK